MRIFDKFKCGRGENKVLSAERKKQIEGCVNGLIDKYKIGVPGFDLTKFLIDNYGFKVGTQDLDKNVKGVILVNDDECILNTNINRLISINRELGIDDFYLYNQEKRFTIACEFAHFVLHKGNYSKYGYKTFIGKSSIEDEEADYFARCLLMPKMTVLGILNADGISDLSPTDKIDFISRAFFVSVKEVRLRFDGLGV